MTEKELLYVEDILEQSSQLKEVVCYYKSIANDDDLINLLDEIEKTSDKEFDRICKFL